MRSFLAVLALGCGGPHALTTEFDVVLDSLTPGLRLGESGADVMAKMPQVSLVSYSVVRDSTRIGRFGATNLALIFDETQSAKEHQPLSAGARLTVIDLSFADEAGFQRGLTAIASALSRPGREHCVRIGDREVRRWEWMSATGGYLYAFHDSPGGRFPDAFRVEFRVDPSKVAEVPRGCGLTTVGD